MDRIGRRMLLGGALPLLVPGVGAAVQPISPIPLFIRVATYGKSDEPVVSSTFVDDLVTEANTVFAEHELSFVEARDRGSVPSSRAALETRADRDGLAEHFETGITNVFVVRSLRDVDDPKLYRMGVMWRFLKNLKKKYVIVAASCQPTTLAHELGHFLGLDHAYVKNNLMSYDRDEGAKVFLDAKQGEKCRRTARGLFAKKELVPSGGKKGE